MNAAYMAVTVMARAFAIGMSGGILLLLVEVAMEIYEEHFKRW